jgi:hypothetical protein
MEKMNPAVAINLVFWSVVVVLLVVGYVLLTRDRTAIDKGPSANATVVTCADARIENDGARMTMVCDLEIMVEDQGGYRPETYRITGEALGGPILEMQKVRPGIVLRAQLHPSDKKKIRVYLPDGSRGTDI